MKGGGTVARDAVATPLCNLPAGVILSSPGICLSGLSQKTVAFETTFWSRLTRRQFHEAEPLLLLAILQWQMGVRSPHGRR